VILIRNTRTQLFFAKGTWTTDRNLADDYSDIRSATAACAIYHLQDTELVAQFDLDSEGLDAEPAVG
jgi:hypothetical protein